jgi:hypothetical protein
LRLEGLTPTPFGESLKERVLAGEISIEQAEAEFRVQYTRAVSRIA